MRPRVSTCGLPGVGTHEAAGISASEARRSRACRAQLRSCKSVRHCDVRLDRRKWQADSVRSVGGHGCGRGWFHNELEMTDGGVPWCDRTGFIRCARVPRRGPRGGAGEARGGVQKVLDQRERSVMPNHRPKPQKCTWKVHRRKPHGASLHPSAHVGTQDHEFASQFALFCTEFSAELKRSINDNGEHARRPRLRGLLDLTT